MSKQKYYPFFEAILATILFGASTPLSKLLQAEIAPLLMSSLLFLGSGLSALLLKAIQYCGVQKNRTGEKLTRGDIPRLAIVVLTGGVAAPVVLIYSLKITPAATASLLLNFESVATILIAVLIFKEFLNKRTLIAIAAITGASFLLLWNPGGDWGLSIGILGILIACALWGVDNNFTRSIATSDPITIVLVKGFCAGTISLLLAFAFGSPSAVIEALILGCLSYGASTILFIFALRHLGAAKVGVFSGVAPFVGAGISFLLFREPLGILFYISSPVMLFGIFLIMAEEFQLYSKKDGTSET